MSNSELNKSFFKVQHNYVEMSMLYKTILSLFYMLLTSYLGNKISTFFIRSKTADFLLFNMNIQQKNVIFFCDICI